VAREITTTRSVRNKKKSQHPNGKEKPISNYLTYSLRIVHTNSTCQRINPCIMVSPSFTLYFIPTQVSSDVEKKQRPFNFPSIQFINKRLIYITKSIMEAFHRSLGAWKTAAESSK